MSDRDIFEESLHLINRLLFGYLFIDIQSEIQLRNIELKTFLVIKK